MLGATAAHNGRVKARVSRFGDIGLFHDDAFARDRMLGGLNGRRVLGRTLGFLFGLLSFFASFAESGPDIVEGRGAVVGRCCFGARVGALALPERLSDRFLRFCESAKRYLAEFCLNCFPLIGSIRLDDS